MKGPCGAKDPAAVAPTFRREPGSSHSHSVATGSFAPDTYASPRGRGALLVRSHMVYFNLTYFFIKIIPILLYFSG